MALIWWSDTRESKRVSYCVYFWESILWATEAQWFPLGTIIRASRIPTSPSGGAHCGTVAYALCVSTISALGTAALGTELQSINT